MAAVIQEQASHTPVPWSVCYDHPDPDCKKSIAHIRAVYEGTEFPRKAWSDEIATIYGCDRDPEQAANARLVAAAPDLLEALKVAYSDIQYLPGHTIDMLGRIEALLTKATGTVS